MTITYPLTWPSTPGPQSVTFSAVNAVALARSPFTYDTQTQVWPGDSWTVEVGLPPMLREQAEEWFTFLATLKGPRGTFYAYDPYAVLPRGVASGSPRVNGAAQTGETLATDGWSADITDILKRGDRFQLGNRLYMVLSNANSNSNGEATLDIWPRLRETPSDDEPLVTVRPKGIFRLASQVTPLWSANETLAYNLSFAAVEAI